MSYLLISDCFYPSKKSISRHIYDLLRKCSKENKTVDFYFPIQRKDKKNFKKKYHLKNINYHPILMNNIKHNNIIIRGVNEFLMPYIFWKKIKINRNKIEKILVLSPSIFFGLIFKKLKVKFNCRIILIIRDIFPDWALQKNIYLWINPLFIFAKIISNFQYYFSDIIAVQSINDKKLLSKKYSNKSIKVLYNWITPSKIKSNKNNSSTNFVFAGTIGPAQSWKNIIHLIIKLSEKKIPFNFYFVGDGKYKNFIKQKLCNYKNVYFINSQTEKSFLKLLAKMDVGVISLDQKIQFNNIPGKFFSYLETNLPILLDANYLQEISKIINTYKIGLTNKDSKNILYKNAKTFIEKKFNSRILKKNYNKVLKEKFSTDLAYEKILKF